MNHQPFDLSSVLAQAAQVTQQQEESNSGGMKLVYPQQGTLKVRLLYNNAAGVVMRKFERHSINKQKVTCLQNYGMECPVCKMIDNIQNATGADLWQMKRTTRGIAYAEYVDSDYKWDDPKNAPAKGEIVILMFPWTIYTDLNRLISSAGQNIYNLIASNVGGVFKISRWSENKQIKYRAEIDPFDQNHQTCATEEEFQKLIMELPSLNEKFVPVEPNDNIIKAAQSMADELNKEYLTPRVQHPNFGQNGMNLSEMAGAVVGNVYQPATTPHPAPTFDPSVYTDPNTGNVYDLINGQWVLRQQVIPHMESTNTPVPPSINHMNSSGAPGFPGGFMASSNQRPVVTAPSNQAPSAPGGSPACFGKHGTSEVNPNSCLLCPSEGQCKSASGR